MCVVHDDTEVLQGHIGVLLHRSQAGALAGPQGFVLPPEVRHLCLAESGERVQEPSLLNRGATPNTAAEGWGPGPTATGAPSKYVCGGVLPRDIGGPDSVLDFSLSSAPIYRSEKPAHVHKPPSNTVSARGSHQVEETARNCFPP